MIYSNHNNKTWLSNNLSGPGFLAGLAIYVCSYVCWYVEKFRSQYISSIALKVTQIYSYLKDTTYWLRLIYYS